MIKIKWKDSDDYYNFGFCVISKNYEQSGGFSSCKDYIQDLYAYFFNKKISQAQYAFETYYHGFEPSKKNIKIAYSTSEFFVSKALDYIHQVENAFGFSTLSKIETSNRRNTFIAIGSEKWLLSTPMISFYTFLLRTSRQHVIGEDFIETFKQVSENKFSTDGSTARRLLPMMEKMIELGVEKIFSGTTIKNYPSAMTTHGVGINGFAHGRARTLCHHWYKDWYEDIDWGEE